MPSIEELQNDEVQRKILSIGFEFETMQMMSLIREQIFYTQCYYYIIDLKNDHIKITNDVIDKEIGKGDDRVCKMFKDDQEYSKIKLPKNKEHTELHITFHEITSSNNSIENYLRIAIKKFISLFNNAESESVVITNRNYNLYKITKRSSVLMINNVNIYNANWVPQMTFSIKLEDLIDVCSFLCKNLSNIAWNKAIQDSESFMKELDSNSIFLKNWLVITFYILNNCDSNYKCEKTEVLFVPRHYFWEFYPFDESYDERIINISENSLINKLIRNIYKFRMRRSLVYHPLKNRIVQNYNPILEDIIETNDNDEIIKSELEKCSYEITQFKEECDPCVYNTKRIYIDTKKYEMPNSNILIEFRGFLHYFNDMTLNFSNFSE